MLGLYQQDASNAYDALARQAPAGTPEPGFFAGMAKAPLMGIAEGAAKVVIPLQGDQPPVMGMNLPESAYVQPPPEELTPEQHAQRTREATAQAIREFAPNPATTGMAGQALHNVASALSRMAVGGTVAGPIGGAAVVGVSEGYATRATLQEEQHVDAGTAQQAGALSGALAGVGALLPAGVGTKLATKLLGGAAIQESAGMANRFALNEVLSSNGYTEQAKQYKVLDAQAMMADAVLGAAFGALHRPVMPSTVDAALTVADAHHAESVAPGVPVDPVSRQNHVDNLTASAEALLSGSDMPPLKPIETVPNPHVDALQARATAAANMAAREAAGEPQIAPYAGERRADAIEHNRINELRRKFVDQDLTPAEKDELLVLQERERLAATVNGRRVPGLRNAVAYEEMLQRGEQLPVQGFADLDMLKTLNDTMGHAIGDDAIRSVGDVLTHYFGEGNAFHRSGDEFILQSPDKASYDSAITAAKQYLAGHVLRDYDAQGNVVREQRGIGLSHGSGETIAEAERAAYADKQARAAAGLRQERAIDRGPMAAKPSAERRANASAAPAGAKAAEVTPAQAVSALTRALQELRDSKGTDEAAHAQVKEFLARPDAEAIAKAATARAGEGARETLDTAARTDHAKADTAALDDATRQAVEQSQEILDRTPDLTIEDESGVKRPAREVLDEAMNGIKSAETDSMLHTIAATCFGRA